MKCYKFQDKDSISSRYGKEEDKNKVNKTLNPWAADSRLWNKIFLALCVIGVSIDPLFLYIPIVDDNRKCIKKDHNMEIIALVLRSVTDFSCLFHVCFRLRNALKMSNEFHLSILTKFPWFRLLIDNLSFLPLPQVAISLYFSEITGSKSLTGRKFINSVLLLQYVPRLLRVYLSAKEIGKGFDSLINQLVWVRCAFFFFLYLNFGHVFGALWYFYSFFRETACWHEACIYDLPTECKPGPFDCSLTSHPINNLTKLNQYCPINPPDPKIFNFGMFSEAIESRIVNNTDFLTKFSLSFFWGLKNLSSFGSNLDTSGNVVENWFAILISILGLLLFLYLIGNLQTYMQLETMKSEEHRKKISIIQPEIDSYLTDYVIPLRKKKFINKYLTSQKIREGGDIDVKYLFSILEEHADQGQHKSHEVPSFQNIDENVYEMICKFLKPVSYLEKSYIIRKGEPIDMLLLCNADFKVT
ncbi:hypothetical protein F8388_024519 [Cannabis sativa]|uniref:Cyclic nucleotide-gated ion channel 1-like n=1 Tax=Cannabis sativa TaxID=3483 RepID=A0A7J6GB94_CANSA|nr:hypothetical protein F8388_024519 [Cannabis sativa]